MPIARVAAVAAVVSLTVAAIGCEETKPEDFQEVLKYHLSQRLRANGYTVEKTELDTRAQYPPVRLNDVVKGVAYILRHRCKQGDVPVMLTTWVYRSRDELIAARPFFRDTVITDLKNEGTLFQWDAVELPPLHLIVVAETPNAALTNQLVTLFRDLTSTMGEVNKTLKEKKP